MPLVPTKVDINTIAGDPNYLVGMGIAENLEEARNAALSNLVSLISVNVQSRFNYIASQKTKDDDLTAEETVDMIVNSYASATLNNVAEYVEEGKDGYTVYRYMKKGEVQSMFRRRVEMARKWAQEADVREKEGKIGDAIQNYYWALALLRSCPDADLETIKIDGKESNFIQHLFLRVKDILAGVNIQATSVEKSDDKQRVTLSFDYIGNPLVNFNYKFYDNKDLTEVYTAKNGVGELWLPSSYKLGKLKLQAEYECREEANIHPDLECVMRSTQPVPFKAAVYDVDARKCPVVDPSSYALQIVSPNNNGGYESTSASSDSYKSSHPAGEAAFLATIKAVENALANRSHNEIRDHFTPEGWDMYTRLITYGYARLVKTPEISLLPDGDGMVCRSFPMTFSFKGNRRTFTEDVVFYLDKDAKIREVAFGLERDAVNDIMRRDDWGLEARQVMIHFLETYKTAYALERIDYINSIFSSEALIITGSVVYSTGNKEMGIASKRQVKYTRQTKEEYIANLKKCFAANEYVNIRFADNIVRRSHTNPNIYGIQIKQDYFSSSYGDTGYLFLMIDFANPDTPLIHVRTWQPDLDPNVKDGRIGMADFML